MRSKYTLGTAARMGPGYFPRILGILLIVARRDPRAARARDCRVRAMPALANGGPSLVVLGSVVLFGVDRADRRPGALDGRS